MTLEKGGEELKGEDQVAKFMAEGLALGLEDTELVPKLFTVLKTSRHSESQVVALQMLHLMNHISGRLRPKGFSATELAEVCLDLLEKSPHSDVRWEVITMFESNSIFYYAEEGGEPKAVGNSHWLKTKSLDNGEVTFMFNPHSAALRRALLNAAKNDPEKDISSLARYLYDRIVFREEVRFLEKTRTGPRKSPL